MFFIYLDTSEVLEVGDLFQCLSQWEVCNFDPATDPHCLWDLAINMAAVKHSIIIVRVVC